jgi:molecular chaperone Hsp33
MIKKKRYGDTLKDQLLSGARDRMYNFVLADGAVRGVILNGTRMINEMRANHEAGILETLVLGRAYLGVALLSADLKGADQLSVKVDCSGPIKGFLAEANAFGEVRGFLESVPIPIKKPMKDFDLSPFFGAGFLSVTKHLKDAKQPFTGKVALKYGNIALDLAHYYLTSEQIPTAFNLSIKFDKDGNVTGAGGLFLQAMPEADDDLAVDLEHRVKNLPSLGEVFTGEKDPVSLVQDELGKHSPRFLADRRIEFMCHCSKERLRSYIMLLSIEELEDILRNGPFPLEMRCQHCNTAYHFPKPDIEKIYGKRFPNN